VGNSASGDIQLTFLFMNMKLALGLLFKLDWKLDVSEIAFLPW